MGAQCLLTCHQSAHGAGSRTDEVGRDHCMIQQRSHEQSLLSSDSTSLLCFSSPYCRKFDFKLPSVMISLNFQHGWSFAQIRYIIIITAIIIMIVHVRVLCMYGLIANRSQGTLVAQGWNLQHPAFICFYCNVLYWLDLSMIYPMLTSHLPKKVGMIAW